MFRENRNGAAELCTVVTGLTVFGKRVRTRASRKFHGARSGSGGDDGAAIGVRRAGGEGDDDADSWFDAELAVRSTTGCARVRLIRSRSYRSGLPTVSSQER